MKKILIALTSTSLILAAKPALSASVNGNFNVTVTLTSVCTMGVIGDLAFGTYTAFQSGTQTATPTTATLTCTRGLTGVTATLILPLLDLLLRLQPLML